MKNLRIMIQRKKEGAFIVELTGPLDTYTSENFDQRMDNIMVNETRMIVLNMAGVDYISSMGIGSIFKVRKFCDENNAQFAMVNVQPQVEKVMKAVDALPEEAVFESIEQLDEYIDGLQNKAKNEPQ